MKKYALIFALVILLQLSGFYALERYLTPTTTDFGAVSVAATATPMTSKITVQPVQPPEDALLFDVDPKGNWVAYLDHQEQLVVKNRKGTLSTLLQLKGVHFLQWLDSGKTLFYMREIYGKNEMGVVKTQEKANQLVPLHDIQSRNITVEKVYKSTYSQSICLLYKQYGTYHAGFYEAIFGFIETPIYGGDPVKSWFDEKQDILSLEDAKGKIQRYAHGKLLPEVKQDQEQKASPNEKTHRQ